MKTRLSPCTFLSSTTVSCCTPDMTSTTVRDVSRDPRDTEFRIYTCKDVIYKYTKEKKKYIYIYMYTQVHVYVYEIRLYMAAKVIIANVDV
ncbi:hypothetical protein PUN28_000054 [Cardiocondyla obscurior]|uniref:Secreted protein n=1 Tax=Cardiocondyla obscurior TaxID=286306 RepID=A0AAW2GXJ3_9HYME